jgi:beta-phosphoglucomutase
MWSDLRMSWISNYQLFLFDFDGLLVNTEELHFLAYQQMMQARGITLNWSFERYCQSAHYSSEKFRKEIFEQYPDLQVQDPTWEILYREKQANMERLLDSGEVHLMPGVEALLTRLQSANLNHVVVTHSPIQLISIVKAKHAVLKQIPHWITRHDYTHPKPNSECYQIAIDRYSKPSDKVIGFEDSPRGVTALLGTQAQAVLITKTPYPEIPGFLERGVKRFDSLEDIYRS